MSIDDVHIADDPLNTNIEVDRKIRPLGFYLSRLFFFVHPCESHQIEMAFQRTHARLSTQKHAIRVFVLGVLMRNRSSLPKLDPDSVWMIVQHLKKMKPSYDNRLCKFA
jgi:hypothetical protein